MMLPLIADYYGLFNQRRIRDAARFFSADATFDHPLFANKAAGAMGYVQFADTWLRAFPDAQLTIDHVNERGTNICEIDLIATGTHAGPLDLGPYGRLKPTGGKTIFRIRELLQFADNKIVHSSLSVDVDGLLYQLADMNYAELTSHLDRIQRFREELTRVGDDGESRRRVIEGLGHELDAARMIVRPWFKR